MLYDFKTIPKIKQHSRSNGNSNYLLLNTYLTEQIDSFVYPEGGARGNDNSVQNLLQ